jgi:hypothetical protein
MKRTNKEGKKGKKKDRKIKGEERENRYFFHGVKLTERVPENLLPL